PSPGNCRCVNDNRTVCDEPFASGVSECPACVGGGARNTQKCASNTDCFDTSACGPATKKVCSSLTSKLCTTNGDCTTGMGTCTVNRTVCTTSSSTLCSTNTDCNFQGTCTGQSACTCYFGAPFPLSSGGTPACIVNRFAEPISGTANVDLGAGEITARLRTGVFLGYETRFPCATCGGSCSNNPETFCDRDEDCTGGTCNLDPTPNDGDRGGVCGPGSTSTGQSCDVNGTNSSFPAYTSGPNGGAYSIDCLPSTTALAGQGLAINLTQTTGTSVLESHVSCQLASAPELTCPCLTCSADPTLPCNTHEDCASLAGSCSLSTPTSCLGNADCMGVDVGPCLSSISRCDKARTSSAYNCTTNADCVNRDVGVCNAPTCTSRGVGNFPQPNNCTDQLCSDIGGGIGECTIGPDAQFCAGVLTANGLGVLSCQFDDDCTQSGVDARPCSLLQRNGCFFDPIVATGSASPSTPIGAATFCIPPVANQAINDVAGLPGPGRVVNQAVAKTFCASDPTKQYIPGVGGCLDE
ncbi:MAG: hypothetical protein ABR587_11090, partial [Candidatus Binatia bacterium]